MKKKKTERDKIMVLMASRQRCMRELDRVTCSPDTSDGGSPREKERTRMKIKENDIHTTNKHKQKKTDRN